VKSALACGTNSLFQQAAYFTGQPFSLSVFEWVISAFHFLLSVFDR
jgi:hypothetical protein